MQSSAGEAFEFEGSRHYTMEDMASAFSYQQSIEELKHALLCTTMELESAQMAVEAERRRSNENEKQLLQLLGEAFQQRDEAKDQLQKLLSQLLPNLPQIISPISNSSGATESDVLSDAYNCRSCLSSSPENSMLSSPDLQKMNTTATAAESDNAVVTIQPLLIGTKASRAAQIDPGSAAVDRLAWRKPLPQKGRLLKAVMEAGPLLQTLLLAGPLPQWRNPPPPDSSMVPPVSITPFPPQNLLQRSTVNSGCDAEIISSPIIHHRSVSSCSVKRPPAGFDDFFSMSKRQNFQC